MFYVAYTFSTAFAHLYMNVGEGRRRWGSPNQIGGKDSYAPDIAALNTLSAEWHLQPLMRDEEEEGGDDEGAIMVAVDAATVYDKMDTSSVGKMAVLWAGLTELCDYLSQGQSQRCQLLWLDVAEHWQGRIRHPGRRFVEMLCHLNGLTPDTLQVQWEPSTSYYRSRGMAVTPESNMIPENEARMNEVNSRM